MSFDVHAFRAHFPSLTSGVAHFDGPGGTQTPRPVGEAIAATMTGPLSLRGSELPSERNAEQVVAAFRSAYADFLGVPERGVVHGRSSTQLTYDFSHHLSRSWGSGDEVVVTRLDHDANVRPWVQAAERAGAAVRWLDLDPETALLRADELDRVITDRTRLVAVTAASNLLGTRPPVRAIADRAHEVGALVHVDAVHHAAHGLVDATALGADFVVCSPYKFFGPHCGVLGADPALLESLSPDKLVPSTNAVPERFEFGTLPFESLAGATAAVDFLAAIAPAPTRRASLEAAYRAVAEHEHALLARLTEGLAALGDRVLNRSRATDRTPTTLLELPGHDARAAYRFLAERDVLAPAGAFYAHEAALALGLPESGGLRIGIAPYTTEDEIDRLLDGLAAFTTA
ncbi:cysteine desulfurase-like protein [Actinosynnema sp.]|uniref:cysteine desulfurase-like protein n=1 Tax=Actinosynnema sp. TaxID=1872144 RepID=UPI003F87BF21